MLYKISNVVIKNPDWKLVTVDGVDGVHAVEVSVNRADKSGIAFPNYDAIVDGADVEGTLWTSPNGKKYLFAPKPKSTGNSKNYGAITKAMERKEDSIEKFQDNKEMSIKVSSTFRDATMLTIASFEGKQPTEREMKEQWLKWRVWLYENWNNVMAYPTEINPEDVPF